MGYTVFFWDQDWIELGGCLGEGLLLSKRLFASEYRRGCVGEKGTVTR